MITITRGKDKKFTISLTSKSTGRPKDLTTLVAAKIKFKKTTGSPLILQYPTPGISIQGNALLGVLLVDMSAVDTPDLKVVDGATMEVEHEFGLSAAGNAANDVDITYIDRAYTVKKSDFE